MALIILFVIFVFCVYASETATLKKDFLYLKTVKLIKIMS